MNPEFEDSDWFEEFIRRYGTNPNLPHVRKLEIGFGRYLTASRYNLGQELEELAKLTGISSKKLTAIESGKFHVEEIEDMEIEHLAYYLGEDIEIFMMLLGRKKP